MVDKNYKIALIVILGHGMGSFQSDEPRSRQKIGQKLHLQEKIDYRYINMATKASRWIHRGAVSIWGPER